ncbi:MAG: serine/threonine-protein kinase [Myxococcota bacterium]
MAEGAHALQVRAPGRTTARTAAAWRRLLAGVLLALVALDAAAAVLVHAQLDRTIRARGKSAMETLMAAEAASSEAWFRGRRATLDGLRLDGEAMAAAREVLVAPGDAEAVTRLRAAAARRDIEAEALAVVGRDGRVALGAHVLVAGEQAPADVAKRLAEAPVDRASVVLPFALPGAGKHGLDVVPVKDGDALVGWLVRPVDVAEFLAGPFRGATLLKSGELYAFNREGVMLSESRFPGELRQAGLLGPDGATTVLEVELRDPGVQLSTGQRPQELRRNLPFTRPVQAALSGQDGEDFVGFRDYRGVRCFAVWRWMRDDGYGLVLEVDEAEALEPVRLLRPLLLGLVIVVGVVLMGAAWLFLAWWRAERRARTLGDEAAQLGQYQLVRKLGEGGMGVVYEARHALLHRPAALKLMQPGTFTVEQAARFEREVQVTAALAHPNTVSIFDYGKSDDGTFYYVMELLEGCDLERLVHATGPMPAGRVAHVLRQVCGSLAEAHLHGLVHRDVKPANVYLTARAGVFDVVKLLDFGLVKTDNAKAAGLTKTQLIMGTPLYMAPELFEGAEHASVASDVYAVGAVAFWLLTGRPVFDDTKPLPDLMMEHRASIPPVPSKSLGQPVDAALERFIASCLAKRPGDRPASMEALLAMLDEVTETWRAADARAWWLAHGAALGVRVGAAESTPTVRPPGAPG